MIKKLAFVVILITIVFSSCEKNKNTVRLEGDLYHPKFSNGNFYKHPEDLVKFKKILDSIGGYENLKKENATFWKHFEVLDKNNLLENPFINLRTEKSKSFTVYLKPEDYHIFTTFKLRDLNKTKKKVRVILEVDSLSNGQFYCTKLISTTIINRKP